MDFPVHCRAMLKTTLAELEICFGTNVGELELLAWVALSSLYALFNTLLQPRNVELEITSRMHTKSRRTVSGTALSSHITPTTPHRLGSAAQGSSAWHRLPQEMLDAATPHARASNLASSRAVQYCSTPAFRHFRFNFNMVTLANQTPLARLHRSPHHHHGSRNMCAFTYAHGYKLALMLNANVGLFWSLELLLVCSDLNRNAMPACPSTRRQPCSSAESKWFSRVPAG